MRPIDIVQVKHEIQIGKLAVEYKNSNVLLINKQSEETVCIAPLIPQNEWVSVKDRLPDFDVPVLVYVIDVFDNKGTISITKYTITYDLTNNWLGYENSSFKITHWMPLPAPPNSRPPEEENT